METNHYEVVICGGDLTGLIAGALLARRGLRVLVCDLDRTPAYFDAAEYKLATDPGLIPPPDSEPVARVLRELNQVQVVRRRAFPLHPGVQLVLGEQRARLRSGGPEELTQAYPGEANAIEDVFARLREVGGLLDPLLASDVTLPPHGFWERRDAARIESRLPPSGTDLLAPLPVEHPLRSGLAALSALSSGLAPMDLNATVLARSFEVARRGLYRMDGGGALRALLIERLETAMGEVRAPLVPAELIHRRGRIVAMRMRPRDETIGLDHLVWAGPAAALLALCGDKASRRLREIAGGIRPACYRYTLCLLVRPEGIPSDLGPRAIVVNDPTRPLLEDNALAITCGSPTPSPEPRVPVWVDCLVPAGAAVTAGSGYLAMVRARVRERLERLMPSLVEHLLVLVSAHDGLPPELPERPQTQAPEPIAATPMAAALSCDLPRSLAISGVPHATGLRNVYLAGQENLPGLGREGDFVSAWGVARLIAPVARQGMGRREIFIENA